MKDFAKFFLFQVAVLIIMIIILVGTAFSYKAKKADVIVINDYAQTVKENWGNPSVLEYVKGKTDILILDRNNKVIYSTSDNLFKDIRSPLDAIERDMLTIAINDDDVFLGTMIVPDPEKDDYSNIVKRLLVMAAIVSAAMLLSYAAFFVYINKNIIKPFKRMKDFAGAIAMGDLDKTLNMEKNNIFGVFTESFDIMREELKASREREIALKLKEKELVASLSHDLKTPVTGIKLLCEMLLVKVEDLYVKKKIENISSKTVEINTLLDDLLASTLEDMGELKVNCAELDSSVLCQLVDEHDPRKKVDSENVPECILYADRKRLSQVIGNIIGNSYKYADTDIEVKYRFVDGFLEMKISDHGEGVAEEELELLTNKFYRGSRNTSDKEGSGLGLYISSELMKKMKGQLICDSDKDGFTVTLMIPLA